MECPGDATGEILGLSDARMANIVGITLVAITSDGPVLFVRQTARNSVLPKASQRHRRDRSTGLMESGCGSGLKLWGRG